MTCIIEFSPQVRFEFCKNKHKQKLLVDALLQYSCWEISHLATAMHVSVKKLENVRLKKEFLNDNQANDLSQLFLLFFGE